MKIIKHNYIKRYYKEIKSGKIAVCEKTMKVMDMLMPIVEGKDKKYHFDPLLANRPIVFIENFCRQSKGATGQLYRLA